MSRYRFIASDKPLLEIELSGFVKLKVKDKKCESDAKNKFTH